MSAEYFLDTNVLLYVHDKRVSEKQARTVELMERAPLTGAGVISWQVVQEFCSVILHEQPARLALRNSRRYLEDYLEPLCQVWPDPGLWRSALNLHEQTGYRLYDSLIVAGALTARVPTLYSEDLQDGRRLGSLTIVNPFHDLPAAP